MEEVRVSDVEVCNLAYRGQLEQLRSIVLGDKALASRTDQVRGQLPYDFHHITTLYITSTVDGQLLEDYKCQHCLHPGVIIDESANSNTS